MTDQAPPEYLSSEELRNRLYHSLRNRGLVDSIKSQLRNSLVTELKQSVRGPLTLKDLKVPEDGSLLHRASNSLVANHLRACKYEYTLSVFLPECGLNQDKKFDTSDLLKLLNISPQSRLYQRLNDDTHQDSKRGFLWQLLSEVCGLHSNSINNVGCQTDLLKFGPITPLDVKLSDVDELYSSRREDFLLTGRAGAEERMLNFQRQLEDRYNTQLKMELARMRDAEIAAVKMEEKENNRKTLEQTRRDLERVYKDKQDALVLRERNATERLQQQMELQERETYTQRQTILEEIEAVRNREAEVKKESEFYKREKRVLEDRIKDKEGDLRRRELEVKQKETSIEQRLQNDMAQFKLDQQTRYIDRIQNIEAREAAVKEGERVVSEEKASLQEVKDELRSKSHRVNELETMMSEAKYSEINANKNNEYLNAKLRDMSDYKTLKEQVILYRNELESVRTRLAEVLSMNERERGRQEELLRELRRPSPESLMLHRDLERAKESLRQEQVVFNQQKQLLEVRLKEELDRNKDLLQRFEEQTLQMKEMNREIVDLRQHLHMTTRALNNEVYRKPNDETSGPSENESRRSQRGHSASRRSVDLNLDSPGPRRSLRFEADTKDVYHDVDFDLPQGGGGDYHDEDVSSVDSADVVAHAKYRLMNLDKEAHNLEKAYHNFHCRITNIQALPLDGLPSCPQDGRTSGQGVPDVGSPRQSPILFDDPMSSTPYKEARIPQDFNDSFSELGNWSHRQKLSEAPGLPQFDLSSMTGDVRVGHRDVRAGHGDVRAGHGDVRAGHGDVRAGRGDVRAGHGDVRVGHGDVRAGHRDVDGEARREKMRPITVDDLEQRSGSPEIIIVAESVSSNEDKKPPVAKPAISEPVFQHPSSRLADVEQGLSRTHHNTTTSAQPFSLDSAWKCQQEEEEEREASPVSKGRQPQLEDRQEMQQGTVTAAVGEDDGEGEDKIDPVMKEYMARVVEDREREKAKKSLDKRDQGQMLERTPTVSEAEDLSVAEEDKSEQTEDSW